MASSIASGCTRWGPLPLGISPQPAWLSTCCLSVHLLTCKGAILYSISHLLDPCADHAVLEDDAVTPLDCNKSLIAPALKAMDSAWLQTSAPEVEASSSLRGALAVDNWWRTSLHVQVRFAAGPSSSCCQAHGAAVALPAGSVSELPETGLAATATAALSSWPGGLTASSRPTCVALQL